MTIGCNNEKRTSLSAVPAPLSCRSFSLLPCLSVCVLVLYLLLVGFRPSIAIASHQFTLTLRMALNGLNSTQPNTLKNAPLPNHVPIIIASPLLSVMASGPVVLHLGGGAPAPAPVPVSPTSLSPTSEELKEPTFHASPKTSTNTNNKQDTNTTTTTKASAPPVVASTVASPPKATVAAGAAGSTASTSTSTHTGSSSIVFSGILTKLGTSLISKWRMRFFVLKDADFTYYDSVKDYSMGVKPLGRLTVDSSLHCESATPSDLEWKFVSTGKTVVVRSTLPEKQQWYDAIAAHVAKLPKKDATDGKQQHVLTRATSAVNIGRPTTTSNKERRETIGGEEKSNGVEAAKQAEEVDEVTDIFTGARETSEARPTALSLDTNSPTPKDRSESVLVTSTSPTPRSVRSRTSGSMIFPPTVHPSAAAPPSADEVAARLEKRRRKSRMAQELFGWPEDEVLIKDFSSALEKTIMLHGRLYVSEHFLGFASSVFSQKLCVPLGDIISVVEANQALIFPNAIKIFVRANNGQTTSANANNANANTQAPTLTHTEATSYFFGSFAPGGRAKAFQLINSLIAQTFDPKLYYSSVDPTTISRSSSLGSIGGEDSTTSECVDGDGDGDCDADVSVDGDSGSAGKLKLSDSLEFGSHRPAHDGSAAIDMKEMLTDEFAGITPKIFFRLFMADAALYTAEQYHKTRGDVWTQQYTRDIIIMRLCGTHTFPPTHPRAYSLSPFFSQTDYASSCWKDSKLLDGVGAGWSQVRDTMVRVPVVSPVGPDSTRVLKVQKMRTESDGSITMETVAVTPDMPFGDCFHLVDSWRITETPTGSKITIKLGVNIHKPNWKLKAIKGMLMSRALGDNQKGFLLYIGEMKNWLATHPVEVEAVKNVMLASAKKKAALATPLKNSQTAPTPASPNNAAASHPTNQSTKKTSFGPLQTYVNQLPQHMQTMPIVAGLVCATLLLLLFILRSSLGSSHSSLTAASPSSSTSGLTHPAASHLSVSSGGMSWSMLILLTLLIGCIGVFAIKVNQLEAQVKHLKEKEKREKEKEKDTH